MADGSGELIMIPIIASYDAVPVLLEEKAYESWLERKGHALRSIHVRSHVKFGRTY